MLTFAGCASEAVAVPTSHRLKRRSILTMLLTPGSLSLPLAATRVSSRRSTSLRRLKPFCVWACLQSSKLNSEQPLEPGDRVYEARKNPACAPCHKYARQRCLPLGSHGLSSNRR